MDNTKEYPQQNSLMPEDEGIEIKKYIFLIAGHWWWFAISIFVSLTIAYLVNRYSQKIYSASCSIIVGEATSGSGSVESMLDELSRSRANKRKSIIENEISILKSYKLARLALEELDFGVTYTAVGKREIAETQLYKQCPFIVEYKESEWNTYGYPVNIVILSKEKYRLIIDDQFDINREMKFGEKFVHPAFNFIIKLTDPENFIIDKSSQRKYYFVFNNLNSLALHYSQALIVSINDQKGAVLSLSMQGYVPEQLSDYLNKISEIYLRNNLDEKNRTSENTIRFIDLQLNGIVDSLEKTGLKLQQFRSSNRVIDIGKEGSFLFNQIEELHSEKSQYQLQYNYFNYLLNYINKKNAIEDIVAPGVIGFSDDLLNSLVNELNKFLLERRNLVFSMNENSAPIVILDNKIENTKQTLKENLQSLIESNLVAQKNVQERINKIDVEVKKLPNTEKQMIDIQRKFSINDQIYTFLLQKRAEAGITKASNNSDHKILDIARPENIALVKPKVSSNYMMGLMAGVGIPLVLLILFEFFDNKITDRNYLEKRLQVPIIGNIGHNDVDSEIPVFTNSRSSMAESFRAIRSNLKYILKKQGDKVIAVSSAVSGEGKTYCSVNLACILASTGKKTLILSLDLRKPKVHKIFEISNEEGISTYLIGKQKYEDMFSATQINNLFLTTAGPIPPNPAEMMGTEEMKDFIKRARNDFDYIIIDTPPIGIVTDALALKESIDSFMFVIRHNYSNKHVVELVNELHDRNMFDHICVAVNDIQMKGYYGYSYKYGYQYGYGYGSHYYEYEDYLEKKPKKTMADKVRALFNIKK